MRSMRKAAEFEGVTGCYIGHSTREEDRPWSLYDAETDTLYVHMGPVGNRTVESFWVKAKECNGDLGWRLHPGHCPCPPKVICAQCEGPVQWATDFLCEACRMAQEDPAREAGRVGATNGCG